MPLLPSYRNQCIANRFTGFYVRATLAFDAWNLSQFELLQSLARITARESRVSLIHVETVKQDIFILVLVGASWTSYSVKHVHMDADLLFFANALIKGRYCRPVTINCSILKPWIKQMTLMIQHIVKSASKWINFSFTKPASSL